MRRGVGVTSGDLLESPVGVDGAVKESIIENVLLIVADVQAEAVGTEEGEA